MWFPSFLASYASRVHAVWSAEPIGVPACLQQLDPHPQKRGVVSAAGTAGMESSVGAETVEDSEHSNTRQPTHCHKYVHGR